jgi:hypothetical protein
VKNHRLKLPIYLLFFTISPLAVQKFLLDTLIAKNNHTSQPIALLYVREVEFFSDRMLGLISWDGRACREGDHRVLGVQVAPNDRRYSLSYPCSHLASSLVEPDDDLSKNHMPCLPTQGPFHLLVQICAPFHGTCNT